MSAPSGCLTHRTYRSKLQLHAMEHITQRFIGVHTVTSHRNGRTAAVFYSVVIARRFPLLPEALGPRQLQRLALPLLPQFGAFAVEEGTELCIQFLSRAAMHDLTLHCCVLDSGFFSKSGALDFCTSSKLVICAWLFVSACSTAQSLDLEPWALHGKLFDTCGIALHTWTRAMHFSDIVHFPNLAQPVQALDARLSHNSGSLIMALPSSNVTESIYLVASGIRQVAKHAWMVGLCFPDPSETQCLSQTQATEFVHVALLSFIHISADAGTY